MQHDDPELRIPDRVKRQERNCENEDNENIAWDWAPSLRRCPKSQLDDEVWMMFGWWHNWKMTNGQLLPFGSSNLSNEPAFVSDVILVCEQEMISVQNYISEKKNNA